MHKAVKLQKRVCAGKIRLHNFISLRLPTEKQAMVKVANDHFFIRSKFPNKKWTYKTSDDNSIAVKFSDISEIAVYKSHVTVLQQLFWFSYMTIPVGEMATTSLPGGKLLVATVSCSCKFCDICEEYSGMIMLSATFS